MRERIAIVLGAGAAGLAAAFRPVAGALSTGERAAREVLASIG